MCASALGVQLHRVSLCTFHERAGGVPVRAIMVGVDMSGDTDGELRVRCDPSDAETLAGLRSARSGVFFGTGLTLITDHES